MTAWTIVSRSARYYWRTHLGVILGAALGAMVLTGALLVGDSVKATLVRQALARVGGANAAMVAGDRFFRSEIADTIGDGAAPALLLRGSVARGDGSGRVNNAQVLGVDARFWQLAPGATSQHGIAINERLATQLAIKPGDAVVVRVEKPGVFSRDAPLSGDENEIVAMRLNVDAVIGDEDYGRFGLQASQVPPNSIFLPLDDLQKRLSFPGRANILLSKESPDALEAGFKQHWVLQDASLELRKLATGGFELRSPRVFLDPIVEKSAPRGLESLTYLVNELRAGDAAVPYSMVTAIDAAGCGFLPAELADNEIAINQWLADELHIGPRDKMKLTYYVMGERRQLEERTREFEVLAVVPMDEPQLNASWMPEFPGLSDAKNCRDWKPGFALDETKIRDQDEAYWNKYRGTPKAFVNIAVGQQMWGNRWGELTSIRYPATALENALSSEIRAKLTLAQIGMNFLPLREQALAATKAPVDFGQLFVSFSFFLIAAAAVLTGLLFVFSIEQRNAEVGLLLALGLRQGMVRRMFLLEGALMALIGSAVGAVGAVIYTKLVLRALTTVWSGAVGAVKFEFSIPPATLATGIGAGVASAVLAMWLASRRQMRQSARQLLSGEFGGGGEAHGKMRTALPAVFAVASIVAAGALLGLAHGAEAFFGAGSLLLIAGILGGLIALRAIGRGTGLETLAQLGLRNAARRRGRSLATVGVLASGVFMVVAVDSFRHGPNAETIERDSGTGGFALVAESALPIYEDLNSTKGREAYGLNEADLSEVSAVPMRVRDGDDASCLNLNRALEPRLLGVKPGDLEKRKAFAFSSPANAGWSMLDAEAADGTVPGIVDAATLQWALQMKLGDVLTYQDERGEPLRVRLIATLRGSILQGSVLIAERDFTARFPSRAGYRFFLIDAPHDRLDVARSELSRGLQDRGLEVTPAAQRLAEFQAVENTYLSIFQVLGGLGLLLGSAGLAIVVSRNVLERRREFGLLEAVGFRPAQLRSLVFAEHRWLIACGLAIGTASALVAVWPNLTERANGFPYGEMGLLLAGLVVGCIFWAWLATRIALRGSGVAALRAE